MAAEPEQPEQPDRMPALAPAEMTPEQQAAVSELVSGPRGNASGPFAVLVRSPRLMTHVQRAGGYLRFESVIAGALLEMTVLLVARRWDQPVEWAIHEPLARAAGVPPPVLVALAADRRPEHLPPDLAVAWELVNQVTTHAGTVDDLTYAAAIAALGEAGVVELLTAAGYYTMLAMIMNACRTRAPGGPVLPVAAPS